MKRLILALTLGPSAILTMAARPAHALFVVNSPFGPDTPVEVVAANRKVDHVAVVIFRRLSDSFCNVQNAGSSTAPGSGLTDHLEVNGSSGNDRMILARAPGRVTCRLMGMSFALDYEDLGTQGYGVLMYGHGGNDVISNTGHNGFFWLYGGAGNDRITTTAGDTGMVGDDGDDTLIGLSTGMFGGTTEYYNGGPGNDCLDDRNKVATGYDCGHDSDRFVSLDFGLFQSLCDIPVASCP